MIQPLQLNSNINFKSNPPMQAANAAFIDNTKEKDINAQQQVEKKTFAQTCESAKKTVTDVFKKANTVLSVGAGATHGVVEGAVVAGLIGVVGKNIKNAQGQIGGTIKGLAKDALAVVKVVPKTIKAVWANSPKENLGKLFKEVIPSTAKKVGSGLKKHNATAAIAVCAGLAIFALRTIQGKVNANSRNANIDHSTNQGHV